jgi:hypothetical protein
MNGNADKNNDITNVKSHQQSTLDAINLHFLEMTCNLQHTHRFALRFNCMHEFR